MITIRCTNHKEIAKAICDMYKGCTIEDSTDEATDIEITKKAEEDICYTEEGLQQVCEDLSAKLSYDVIPDNFEF